MTPRLPPLFRVALLVLLGDLLTKWAAVAALGQGDTAFTDWLRLTLVYNDRGAFGISLGPYTWQLGLVIKVAAVMLMLSARHDLTRIDARAPVALGLIVGAALGNLASLLTSPAGVVDFIAVAFMPDQELVLNGADLAAYAGLAMLARTACRVVGLVRSPARAAISQRLAGKPIALRLVAAPDREIARAVDRAADLPPQEGEPDLWQPRYAPGPERVRAIQRFDDALLRRPIGADAISRVEPRVIDIRSRLADRPADRQLET